MQFLLVRMRPRDDEGVLVRLAALLDGLARFGPLSGAFAEAAPEQAEKARQAIAAALKPHAKPEGIALPGSCWLVRARPATS